MPTVVQSVSFLRATFNGAEESGPVSVPGLKAGDFVLKLQTGYGVSSDDHSGQFEKTVTVDDEIQQHVNFDLSTTEMYAIILRGI